MNIFNSIRQFKQQLDKFDSSVARGNQSLMEVYERNRALEIEIAQRTKELDRANKQMLSLQHVWEMMNSSEPLSNVLNSIVNSLYGELGYLNSFIVKKQKDDNGDYVQVISSAGKIWAQMLLKEGTDIQNARLCTPNIADINIAIQNEAIYQSIDVKSLIANCLPEVDETTIDEYLKTSGVKSYILVPLISNKSYLGSLIVFSSREEIGDNELAFLTLFAKQIELAITIADLFQVVREQAVTDGMTGLYNRRYFEEAIKKEVLRADRQNQVFSVIGLDLDHLKIINDTYGHNYGDLAIKTIANVIKKNARSIDIAARMGGEEFNIILPGIDSKGAYIAAERIRKSIEEQKLEKIGNITASLGVATYKEHSDNIEDLLELTDQAMYISKKSGRNRVTTVDKLDKADWQEVALKTFTDIVRCHRVPLSSDVLGVLNKKLNEKTKGEQTLYDLADIFTKIYNPEHHMGGIKKKFDIACQLAKKLNLPIEKEKNLKVALLLYDIGNTMLPMEILSKSEPLSTEDRESIKQHPLIATHEILKPISAMADIIPIIENHHENWNGTGYPNNNSKDNIPLESQIITIIDSFFALMEDRPYRKAMNSKDALKIIESEIGQKWSQDLTKSFIEIINNESL